MEATGSRGTAPRLLLPLRSLIAAVAHRNISLQAPPELRDPGQVAWIRLIIIRVARRSRAATAHARRARRAAAGGEGPPGRPRGVAPRKDSDDGGGVRVALLAGPIETVLVGPLAPGDGPADARCAKKWDRRRRHHRCRHRGTAAAPLLRTRLGKLA